MFYVSKGGADQTRGQVVTHHGLQKQSVAHAKITRALLSDTIKVVHQFKEFNNTN
jgi:hypothetical protein